MRSDEADFFSEVCTVVDAELHSLRSHHTFELVILNCKVNSIVYKALAEMLENGDFFEVRNLSGPLNSGCLEGELLVEPLFQIFERHSSPLILHVI